MQDRLSERQALCQHAHEQALAIEHHRSDAAGWQRECDAVRDSLTDRLVCARAEMNQELAAVRADLEATRREAAKAAVLQRQAEQTVCCASRWLSALATVVVAWAIWTLIECHLKRLASEEHSATSARGSGMLLGRCLRKVPCHAVGSRA